MNDEDFEGTLVLESLARVNAVDEFMAAVDSEDSAKAVKLMESAGIDQATICMVLKKMSDPYDEP